MSRLRLIAGAAVISLLAVLPAGAAAGVTVQGTRDGTDVVVSGAVEKVDSPIVRLGEDPAGDTEMPGSGPLGTDLRAFDIQTRANGDITFRWILDALPEQTNGAPGPVYGITWIVDQEQAYELDVGRFDTTSTNYMTPDNPDSPDAALWACVGTQCDSGSQTRLLVPIAVSFEAAKKTVSATVRGTDILAKPGSVIEETVMFDAGVYVAAGLVPSPLSYGFFDHMSLADTYRVPRLTVSLGSAAPSTDQAAINFSTPASVDGHTFSGRVPTASGHAVFARACSVGGRSTAPETVCATGSTGAIP